MGVDDPGINCGFRRCVGGAVLEEKSKRTIVIFFLSLIFGDSSSLNLSYLPFSKIINHAGRCAFNSI